MDYFARPVLLNVWDHTMISGNYLDRLNNWGYGWTQTSELVESETYDKYSHLLHWIDISNL